MQSVNFDIDVLLMKANARYKKILLHIAYMKNTMNNSCMNPYRNDIDDIINNIEKCVCPHTEKEQKKWAIFITEMLHNSFDEYIRHYTELLDKVGYYGYSATIGKLYVNCKIDIDAYLAK